MKKMHIILGAFAFMIVLPSTSCNKNGATWDFSLDKLQSSIIIEPAIVSDEEDLVVKLECDGLKFDSKNISKDTIIVHSDMIEMPKNISVTANADEDGKDVITNIEQLRAKAIPDFNYNVSKYGDAVYIAIPEKYKNSNLNIVMHPSCSNAGEYITTDTFTGQMPDFEIEPYLESNYEEIESGEKDPQFRFNYMNLGETHDDKIAFSGSLADLQLDKVVYGQSSFLIKTKGTVKKEESGCIAFMNGYSDAIDTDLYYNFNTKILAASVDYSSLYCTLDGGFYECGFDVYFSSDIGNIEKENVTIKNAGDLIVNSVYASPEYKMISIIVESETSDLEEFLRTLSNASFVIKDSKTEYTVTVQCNEPTFYTTLLPDSKGVRVILSIEDGMFHDEIKLKKEQIVIENGNGLDSSEQLNLSDIKDNDFELTEDGCYEIVFEKENPRNFNYTRGELTFKDLKFCSSYAPIEHTKTITTDFYYNVEEISKDVGKNLKERQNATTPEAPVEEVYEDVVKDKFPWQLGVKLANLLFTAGAAFAGCESGGQAAFTAIGLLLGIADAIGDISTDPLASIIMQLQVIDGKLDIISQQLAKLAKDMETAHSEIYHGVKKNTFLLYRNRWDEFNNYILEFEREKRNYKTSVLENVHQWLVNSNEGDSRSIKLDFTGVRNEEKGVMWNFNQVFKNYDDTGKRSTDDTEITSHIDIKIENVADVLPNTWKAKGTNYNKNFTKTFEDDIVSYIEKHPDFDASLKIIGDKAEEFKKEKLDDIDATEKTKKRHYFAKSLLYAIFNEGNRNYFSNDEGGKERVKNITNNAIDFFDVLSGRKSLGGTGARFTDFYNMLYNKYSFQGEAMKPIKIFRTKLKKVMYDYAAFAHNGLTLLPLGTLRDDLKDSYEYCEKIFDKETGLKDTDAKAKQANVMSCDFCYVTGTFVSLCAVKNRTEAICKKNEKSSYGARSTSWITSGYGGSATWKQINLTTVPFVDEQKIKWTFERTALNGFINDEKTIYQHFKDLTVAIVNKKPINFLTPEVENMYGADKNNPTLLTSYSGLKKVTNNITYNPTLYGTVTKKICGKYCGNWTKIGNKVELYFKNRDRKYYHIWRGVGNVISFNNPNVHLRDNLGHAWWLAESHWYWVFTGDEFWGIEEFTSPTYYYALVNII